MARYKAVILAAAIAIGGATGASATVIDTGRIVGFVSAGQAGDIIGDLIKDLLGKLRDRRDGGGTHPVPGPVAAVGLPFLLAAGGYGLIRRRRRNRDRSRTL